MKLHIETIFPTDPDTVWNTFYDPAFDARLESTSGIRYETQSDTVENGVEVRKIKCTAKKELPKLVSKALGSDHLSYMQHNRLDRKKNRLEWQVIPMALADKVEARGVTTIVHRDGKSFRTVDGEITVKIPLVGAAIEKTIVAEIETSFRKAAELALQIMKERGQA